MKSDEFSKIIEDIPNWNLEKVIKELKRLLNIQSGLELNRKHPLTITFEEIDRNHREQKFQLRDTLIGKIRLLIKHLLVIENYDSSLLEKFKVKLLKVTDKEYFGERLEINIAFSLIQKRRNFRKLDPPDFEIIENPSFFIECTSTHLTRPMKKIRDLQKKLQTAIRKKSKKDYSNENTALFIDITNLLFHDEGKNFSKDEISKIVKKVLSKNKFGNVTTFAYMTNLEDGSYNSTYIRIDNTKINQNLLKFLDQSFPKAFGRFERIVIPRQG